LVLRQTGLRLIELNEVCTGACVIGDVGLDLRSEPTSGNCTSIRWVQQGHSNSDPAAWVATENRNGTMCIGTGMLLAYLKLFNAM
jgi:hypothetical protein